MKKFYKFATAFLALIMLLPFGTIHAAAYDDCDVNHDGFVDVSDAVATARYLAGDHYISSYNRFDTNKSLTVDATDVTKILAKIVQNSYSAQYWDKNNNCAVSFPTISGFTSDPYASSTAGRTYRRYSYTSSQELTSYTLTPSAATFNSSLLDPVPRHIINGDNRYESIGAENTGIVRLEGDIYGTGFIVGDNIIATAAHCVFNYYSDKTFKAAPTIKLYNANGTLSNTELTPLEVHIPSDYAYAAEGSQWEYDYALIKVSDDLSSYTHFNLGTTYNLTATNFSTIPLYVLGPGMTVNNSSTNNLYYGQGNVLSYTSAQGKVIYYDCDMLPGDSGAPVYTITKLNVGGQTSYAFTAIAINDFQNGGDTGIYNGGSRITKYHLQFFDDDTNPTLS